MIALVQTVAILPQSLVVAVNPSPHMCLSLEVPSAKTFKDRKLLKTVESTNHTKLLVTLTCHQIFAGYVPILVGLISIGQSPGYPVSRPWPPQTFQNWTRAVHRQWVVPRPMTGFSRRLNRISELSVPASLLEQSKVACSKR